MSATINNFDEVIDSRDVIARIEELEAVRERMDNSRENWLGTDAADELAALKALADEASQYAADWQYGEALIRRSYFVDYCKELLEDCGDLPKNLPHFIAIDWVATARNIEADYTPVSFGGVEYLVR